MGDAEGVACLRAYFFDYYTKLISSTCKAELQRLKNSPPDWMPHLDGIYLLFFSQVHLANIFAEDPEPDERYQVS